MRCPSCGGPTQVIATRACAEGFALRRRRRCLGKCGKRFTAYEVAGGFKPSVKDLCGIGRVVHFHFPSGAAANIPLPAGS